MRSIPIYFTTLLFAIAMLCSCKKEIKEYDHRAVVPKTVDEDSTLPSISVNQAKFHNEAFGDLPSWRTRLGLPECA